jgi:hypothetical protein
LFRGTFNINRMKNFGRIFGINMLILVAYTVAVRTMVGTAHEGDIVIALFLMVLVAIHFGVNLVLMIIHFARQQREYGFTYLLNMFLVALIGFSFCIAVSGAF